MKLELEQLKSKLGSHFVLLLQIVAVLWVIELADLLLWNVDLDQFGIHPRTLAGLRNVLFAPFLHYGLWHLIGNTVPFVILGWFVLLRGQREFNYVSIMAGLSGGLGVWLLGASNSVHLGISGIIFGYLGFLLLRGYFERSMPAIGLAVLSLFLYGGMLWGLLPLQPGVSWLGHLFGFAGGGLAAYQLGKR
jgi:membrane associated rhomboid family serine protease